MRFKKYIREQNINEFAKAWADRVCEVFLKGEKVSKVGVPPYIEYFVNPSKKEMKDVSFNREIRFIADRKKKKLYIWHPEHLHEDAWVSIGDGRHYQHETLFPGIAVNRPPWSVTWTSAIQLWSNKMLKQWEWADKYINLTDFIMTKLDYPLKK